MVTKMMVITTSTTLNLPSDWDPINNTFWAWGAGGDGGDQPPFGLSAGGGGGGAAFGQALSVGGASGDLLTITIAAGGGGKAGNSTSVTSSTLGTVVTAASGENAGGLAGLGGPGGSGASLALSNGGGFGSWGGGGGGAAAGPHTSKGNKGGDASTNGSRRGGAGGGGAVGSFDDQDESLATAGVTTTGNEGANGGTGYYGTGAGVGGVGVAGTDGTANTGGGGGGGQGGTSTNGGNGFNGGAGASSAFILALTPEEWMDAPFSWTTSPSGRWAVLSNGLVIGGGGGAGGGSLWDTINTPGHGGAGGFPGGGGGGGGFGHTPDDEGQGGPGAGGLVLIFYEGEDGPGPTPSEGGNFGYYIERMDNRIWPTIDDAWCLDAALEYPMPEPTATLFASSAAGDGGIRSYTIVNGGSGYTAPQGQIFDPHQTGSGAAVILGVSSGVIVTATPASIGSGYIAPVTLSVLDATGVGAVIQPIVTNYTNLQTNTGTFTSSDVGSIIRGGGGKIEVVAYNSSTSVTGNVISPITYTLANDPNNAPVPLTEGQWSMTEPTMTVSGLWHLEGLTVAALADGGVVSDLVVEEGSVTLPVEATQIVVGLPFIAQLQTMYLDAGGGPTVQGRRKSNPQVIIRVEDSRPMQVGVNQPDQAAQPNQATVTWTQMTEVKFRTPSMPAGQPMPLYSGDYEPTNLFGGYDTRGQVAIQQADPVPLTVLSVIVSVTVGDDPGK